MYKIPVSPLDKYLNVKDSIVAKKVSVLIVNSARSFMS